MILKLACEKKNELDINEMAQTNHVAIVVTSRVPPSTLFCDQRKTLIQFRIFKPIVVQFQQKIVMAYSQKKEEPVEEDDKGWIVMTY